jgi:hypothetical protein
MSWSPRVPWSCTLALATALACPIARAAPTEQEARKIALGPGASLGGVRVLAGDSAWNVPIDHLPADPGSAAMIGSLGNDTPLHPDFGTVSGGAPWGIPYVVVAGDTPRSPVAFTYADESDDALYPIPPDPPIEGVVPGRPPSKDGDHHLIILDRDHRRLYELYNARREPDGWKASCGAIFDLFGDTRRPRGWTSADAAGLPVFPGLVRYDEVVEQRRVEHALRFTARRTRKAYVAPASHWASSQTDASLPPLGARFRLKKSVDEASFPGSVRPIIVALKRYGMFLADNGGSLFLSGAPDRRWNDKEIDTLKRIRGRDFEVVRMGNVVTP